jgi:hypothetical protein
LRLLSRGNIDRKRSRTNTIACDFMLGPIDGPSYC